MMLIADTGPAPRHSEVGMKRSCRFVCAVNTLVIISWPRTMICVPIHAPMWKTESRKLLT
ncbi:hypothetical protein Tcan_10086 [Toxocara canis]|uniref:Uncharacterized protein n=1 Tax=Toxocara canis TaxID=6265 RepID=A0A0B2UXL8_TOXCA|nr:hypothetical protein Tcan_10086 [Toxocara canis]